MRTVVTSSTSRRMSRGSPLACPASPPISPSSSSAAKGQRRNHTKTSCRETTKSTKHVITLCSFSSFQPPADTHTSDDGYKYHRTRVRSDSYTMYHFLFVWRIHDNVFDALQRTECESIEATVCAQGGCCGRGCCSAWATTGYYSGGSACRESWRTQENVGQGRRNNGRTAKQRIVGCLASRGTAEYRPALDPGVCYSTVCIEGCRFMSAWLREEEKAPENRQRKKEAKEVDKIEVTPGETVASVRRFKAALTGPT